MGSKTVQVKGAGPQSFPAPDHITLQYGPEDDFLRGRISGLGATARVVGGENPHLSRNIAGSLLTPLVFN